jgi:hypothetical protein
VHLAEVLLLLGAGALAAAATTFLDMGLRIPGHAIVRAVFPMAFGFALVPRRMAGSMMGIGAALSAALLQTAGARGPGFGAMTSLVLTGPLLDLALWQARRGWRLYLGFALAGLGSNLLAMAVRGGAKAGGLDGPAARPLFDWLPQAVASYSLCGLIAGLISAAVWFRLSARREGPGPASPETSP